MSRPAVLEVEVRPAWTYRLPRGGRGDGVMRLRRGVLTRLLHVAGRPVVVHMWQRGRELVAFRAVAMPPAGTQELELAIERMRFAAGVDEDLTEFARRFRGDPLIGEAIHHRPWLRPRRRPWPWEALAWAVTEQLIEARRAAEIQRRIVRRWGPKLEQRQSASPPAESGSLAAAAWHGRGPLRDVPPAELIAGRAPAELAAMDLAPSRALALVKCAREVAAGRADPAEPAADRRLERIPGIGPWTLQVLGLCGRGDPDSLPAGDLAYVKLVGLLAGLGRRATVEEVEEYFAPYEPYRALAGAFALSRWHGAVAAGPPLRLAA
jgi:3-methyladenine DNA glycosylase/8-oxoguanine DNA glycosylase